MGSKMNSTYIPVPSNIFTRTPTISSCLSFQPKTQQHFISSSYTERAPQVPSAITTEIEGTYSIKFQTLSTSRLGISRYPDFKYNADEGRGIGVGRKMAGEQPNRISVVFDVQSLYIPPLTGATTKFLGLPLPPFLKIEIVPEAFEGTIEETGKVDLEFTANFCFSIGSIYRAPPLLVKTVLTSEESRGVLKKGRGERLDKEGRCKLVGVASVDPIDDIFMNSFLGLPTECLADLNAKILISDSERSC